VIKRDAGLIGVEGKGRVGKPHASAHRSCDGAWAINLKIPLLRQWQHETCDPSRCGRASQARTEVFHRLRLGRERHFDRALIRVSFTRVSARFAWPSAGPPRGGRYRTEVAGARTRHNRNS